MRCPMRCGRKPGSCACAGTSSFSPTFAPPSATPALANASSLKPELVEGLDILIVRRADGRRLFRRAQGDHRSRQRPEAAASTRRSTTPNEIERIAGVAFELARTRNNASARWKAQRDEVGRALEPGRDRDAQGEVFRRPARPHMLADAGGMQLVRQPKQFDVIVTDNLFGRHASDVAAMLTGSLGMLPSASLGAPMARRQAQGALRAGGTARRRTSPARVSPIRSP